MSTQVTNRLVHETSPYLKQHAHNPVDWYPWSQEALARAQDLDRPIFLSVGYSACHWCHVMEHESFEDTAVAAILNESFVSIKVDREERPDLDQIYMTAVQMLTGQGGWPMSVFLTPSLQPFYAGTYFPPDDSYGRPSFRRVLLALADAWKTRRPEILQSAEQITEQLRASTQLAASDGILGAADIHNATLLLGRSFDGVHGGFGGAPKFPHPMELRLLLRSWKRFADDHAIHMARYTLERMAMGGIYDHLGGGFHRYSTDREWLVPHFEKMLYDNALLTIAYVEAFQATGDPLYREVVEETLAYVRHEMTSPEGAFYSTQDADSEGEEGKFFVWSHEDITTILGEELAIKFGEVYGVTREGNWEGHNILHRARTWAQNARLLNIAEADLRKQMADARQKLLAMRSRRVPPGRDEKILTAWNGLMIEAFALAAQALQNADYAEAAGRAAADVLKRLRDPDGRLYRTTFAGSPPKFNAYLDDYAYLINALVSLYEATFEVRWFVAALELTKVMIEQFWDEKDGGFFYTGRDHESLIARTKDPHDSSVPSGNGVAAMALLRLAKFTGRADLQIKAEATLRLFGTIMGTSPLAAGQMLIALDFHLAPVDEFAVVGNLESADVKEVLRVIFSGFRPHKVVAATATPQAATIPLLTGKEAKGPVTIYVCRKSVCQAPLVGVDAVKKALGITAA